LIGFFYRPIASSGLFAAWNAFKSRLRGHP
jgi:hypothetical protein